MYENWTTFTWFITNRLVKIFFTQKNEGIKKLYKIKIKTILLTLNCKTCVEKQTATIDT